MYNENEKKVEINLKISKLAKIDWRDISVVAVEQLFGDEKVSCLAGVVWVPEHVLVPVRAHGRRRPAWDYSGVLPAISAASLACCCKSWTFNVTISCVTTINLIERFLIKLVSVWMGI